MTPESAATLPSGISVVVPCYNSETTLRDLVLRLDKVLSGIGEPFEVILVNDGSKDGTWEVIGALAGSYPFVRGLNLMRNYGQHNALLCGIRESVFNRTITLDDDLQNPPEEIPKLLGRLTTDCDVVYGAQREGHYGFWRGLATGLMKRLLQRVIGYENARRVSAFRAFRTALRAAFADYRGTYVSIEVLLSWGTSRFTFIEVEHHPRRSGTTNYTFRKLFTHALNLLTGFSTLPLQFASWLGFILTLFGAGLLLFVLGRYFIAGTAVQGFTFLASAIAIFSGAQLLVLGIIGEYLARMHTRMLDRPPYAIGLRTPQRQ
ncbi:MAG: glycosyltransferase family 2 protein [Calditrichaeota bacterium]|nr:glycosyltransferase family 2 protein [Calditrichota bacterium]